MHAIESLTVVVTPFMQNCRILWASGESKAVVVDPGGDAPLILEALAARKLTCESIWLTHSHLDHCGGARALRSATGARLLGHPKEKMIRERVVEIANLYGMAGGDLENCPEPDEYLSGGETITGCGVSWKVLFTPGHSPGHLCFHQPESGQLIGGDAVFLNSIGRTDLPGGNHDELLRSIHDRILTLPDETVIMPGHGPDTTVGHERATNPYLR